MSDLEIKINPVMTFLKRWREAMTAVIATATVMSGSGLFVYKAFAEGVVMKTAEKVAVEAIEKRLKPVQADVQNIKQEIKKVNDRFDTVNSQQVQTIEGIDFLKELLIETDQVSYQKVKKRRDLRTK